MFSNESVQFVHGEMKEFKLSLQKNIGVVRILNIKTTFNLKTHEILFNFIQEGGGQQQGKNSFCDTYFINVT